MTRNIPSATETASQVPVVAPVFFVEFQFDEAPVCLHTHLGDITWGCGTYTGAGENHDPQGDHTAIARKLVDARRLRPAKCVVPTPDPAGAPPGGGEHAGQDGVSADVLCD